MSLTWQPAIAHASTALTSCHAMQRQPIGRRCARQHSQGHTRMVHWQGKGRSDKSARWLAIQASALV